MWAAAEGNADAIRALLAGGADLNGRSTGGFTAFLFAVREGKINAVKALLEAGASLNESVPRRGAGADGVVGTPLRTQRYRTRPTLSYLPRRTRIRNSPLSCWMQVPIRMRHLKASPLCTKSHGYAKPALATMVLHRRAPAT